MTDYKCKRCRDIGKFCVVTAGGDEVLVDCECRKVTTFPLERIARLQIELAQAKELIELKDEALTKLEAEFDATCNAEELRQVREDNIRLQAEVARLTETVSRQAQDYGTSEQLRQADTRIAELEAKDTAWRKAVEDFRDSHIKVRHMDGDDGMWPLSNLFALLYGSPLREKKK